MEKIFKIKNRFSGETIFSFKCLSFSLCVQIAIELNKDLTDANLTGANLTLAELTDANLTGANLTGANLNRANLTGADLNRANLDFSSLPLWCGSLKAKTDERQRRQIAYHLASLIKNSENATHEEIKIFELLKNYANGFHKVGEVEKL